MTANQLENRIWGQVNSEIHIQLCDQIMDPVTDSISDRVGGQLWDVSRRLVDLDWFVQHIYNQAREDCDDR
jgi:hypothetical protein